MVSAVEWFRVGVCKKPSRLWLGLEGFLVLLNGGLGAGLSCCTWRRKCSASHAFTRVKLRGQIDVLVISRGSNMGKARNLKRFAGSRAKQRVQIGEARHSEGLYLCI